MSTELPSQVDESCCMCGAGDRTDESAVSGFLVVPVFTEQGTAANRRVCDSCLSLVLSVVLSRVVSIGGAGTALANLAIEDQDGDRGA